MDIESLVGIFMIALALDLSAAGKKNKSHFFTSYENETSQLSEAADTVPRFNNVTWRYHPIPFLNIQV